jgi:ATP-binding cassette, subfamily B, bacterial
MVKLQTGVLHSLPLMQRYRRLLRYARGQRTRFGIVFVLTLLASVTLALQPWPLKLLVDHVLQEAPLPVAFAWGLEWLGLVPTTAFLLGLAVAGTLALFALNNSLEAVLAWHWTLGGRRMVYDLAEDLFSKLQRRSLLFHSRTSIGDILSRTTADSWVVYQLFETFFAPIHALLTIGVMAFLMWQLDVTMTVLALLIAPLMLAGSMLMGRPLRAAARLKREMEVRLQSHIQQTLTGIPVVQAFAQEERQNAHFEQFASAAIRVQQRSAVLGGLNALTSGIITTLGTVIILWIGAHGVLNETLTIGSLLVFLVYLGLLQAQMKTLAGIYTTLQGISASVDRVIETLDGAQEPPERPDAPALKPVEGTVRLEKVTFGYEPDCPVLRDVTFEAQPGRTIAVVGPTGAGKTTLVNLIPRFFDPWQGRVFVDGVDVREVSLNSLRDQMAIVLQDSLLFPLSVADNIAFGRPYATREDIEAAARAANAHEFIARLPDGYDTVVGERGGTLSGGERQRLSIARALLKNAPILILDEPTSALDAETERLIFEALDRLMKGRTTFVIAHRLSTIRRADTILVLRDGRIVERGKHDELMQQGGFYAQLRR